MMVYVKVCPKCGRKNPESEFNCSGCGYTLIMEEAEPFVEPPSQPPPATSVNPAAPAPPQPPPPTPPPPESNREKKINPEPVTKRLETPGLFFLEIPGAAVRYEVCNGDTIGQAHPSSTSRIQLSGVDGVGFIHRQHCRFDFAKGQWCVTPLPQPDFTNPTTLNAQRLIPGQPYRIKNGDRLTLGQTVLNIRII